MLFESSPRRAFVEITEVTARDYEQISSSISEFIRATVSQAGAGGVVVGLSGGVDSSVAAYLAARALGKEKVLALIMPDGRATPREDVEDAQNLADMLQLERRLIDIQPIHRVFTERLPPNQLAEGNLRARIRMCLLYYYANLLGRLVLGTGDRSEALIGYFTKYGDGGVDLHPLLGLYKTQVRELARHLNLPKRIIEKKSSPRLWAGHDAESEIGAAYHDIDRVLYCIFDLKLSEEETCKRTGLSIELIRRVLSMNGETAHKRSLPYSLTTLP